MQVSSPLPLLESPRLPFVGRLGTLLALAATLHSGGAAERHVEGISEAVRDVTLSLSVPGIVATHHFAEGNLVRSNDVLLELDHRIQSLDCLRREQIMEHRQRDWKATGVVYEKSKSVSLEELQTKELEFKVAEAEFKISCEQVAQRQLRAPAAGVLVDLPVDPGEASEAYQPLARLVDPSQGYLICNLDYADAAGLEIDQVMDIELDTASGPVRLKGTIIFISPIVDKASSLREVKLLFDNPDGRLSLGVPGRLILH